LPDTRPKDEKRFNDCKNLTNNKLMKMKRTIDVIIVLGLIMLVIGCKDNQSSEKPKHAIKVKIEPVKQVGEKPNYYIGTVEETVSIPLSFLTTGTVENVLVTEGQTVKQGQLLAILNSRSAEDAYQIALAKEKQAQDAYDRLDNVHKKGSLPEIKYIEIETGLAQAQASGRLAKKNIDDCNLHAPTDGIIGNRSIELGTNIIPGKTVLTLVKIDKVYINVSVPEKEISKTQIGQKAEVLVAALDGEKFTGEIVEKGVVANPVSHTYNVKILINNNNRKLMPGMVCQVALSNNITSTYLVVSPQAVQVAGNGNSFVYLAPDNSEKPIKRYIQTGGIKNEGIVVTQGLQEGDPVITEGYQKIDENTNISIVR